MWDSLQESGNTQSLTFSPEIGGGQGPRRRPWAGARGWGCEARVPSLPPQLSPRVGRGVGGPCFPLPGARPSPENRRLESRAASLRFPPAAPALPGENGLAPLAPATYGLLLVALASLHGGWARRGQKPLPGSQAGSWGAPEGHRHPFPGAGRTLGERPGATMWDTA